ncbi:MAG: GspE/PulE family protein [Patescibacteria group bacterium]|jgi:type II secretory ATPase GspE/PulE/Tfp pilus assembly ATPase PilB-like protein
MSGANASIEDLLKKNRLPSVTTPDAQSKFAAKMRELELQAKERETAKRGAVIGASYINLKGFPISPEALVLLSQEQSETLQAVVFLQTGDEVRVGAIDPSRKDVQEAIYQVGERAHANVGTYIISEESFRHAVKLYDALPKARKIVKGIEITETELKKQQDRMQTYKDLDALMKGADVTDAVTIIMAGALKGDASDIHVEAEEKDVVVRYRIDGVLQDAARLERSIWPRIISRIKLFSSLKINVANIPQDGRFTIFVSGKKTEVRVSTVPTSYGESVVMRLLRPSTIGLGFDQLGIRGKAFEQLKREIDRPNGMIITTGPTGSGKTTTLYAVLKKLNTSDTKIITLEDPVEYSLEGINQSPIDLSKDYTFAKGLRAILRQDPDVIMVGEIRDLETAETAIQAALTGHLMVSTIHTNSAAGAIPRFLSMGVKPFLLAPALNAVIGQRLVRRVHEACKVQAEPDAEQLKKIQEILGALSPESGEKPDLEKLVFWKGKGCDVCGGSGYKGRVGIYEIFTMSPEIEKVILSGNVSEYQMQEIAVKQGMITMAQDGLLKALDGLTTFEEVLAAAE